MNTASYLRIRTASGAHYGALENEDRVALLSAAPWSGGKPTGQTARLSEVTVLCPVEPSKIVCIGRNYRAHAAELGHDLPKEPLIFLKPPSSLQGPKNAVLLPPQSARVDYEAELGVVMGKRARNVTVAEALSFVFGYTVVCDVTARDLQEKDGQWTRAKGFDTFCPVGPWVVQGLNPNSVAVQLRQNGEIKQDGNTKDMIFDVAQLIAHISSVMTLEPGDLISTGTPHGVGPMNPGDEIVVSISQIGDLSFPVVAG
ncbi:MAG TPA: fumarylacetoacetate hydrolase family protein [Polyangiaceae bacterium]|nr:fumarylacetoacetate hydrolase family protein [Polyangiaceae bacterium]